METPRPVKALSIPRPGKAERQERQERHAGEIIPPAPPCFCLAAKAASAGRESDRQSKLPHPCGSLERLGLRMPECLAGAVRSADAVQVCPHGPTCGGRLLSGLRRTVVSKEEISRFLLRDSSRASALSSSRVLPEILTPLVANVKKAAARRWAAVFFVFGEETIKFRARRFFSEGPETSFFPLKNKSFRNGDRGAGKGEKPFFMKIVN